MTTLSSPLVSGSPWDVKVLMYVTDVSICCDQTYDSLDAWMVWSLLELQEGYFFDVNPFNQKFDRKKSGRVAGPFRGILTFFKGDEKFHQRALKFKQSWVSPEVCVYCKASQSGPYLYTSFGPGALHRSTLFTNEQFIRESCRNNPWIRLPGFHVRCVALDWLHVVDLALTPECAASVPRRQFKFFEK